MPERGGTGRGNAPRRPGETRGGRAFAPIVVRAADGLTRWVTRVLGASATAGRESISEAELRDLVAANVVLSGEERRIIDEVLAAGARHVREVMVPRTDVVFLDAGLPLALAVAAVRTARHSRFPVIDGSHDDVIGFVHLRDLLIRPEPDGVATVGELTDEYDLAPDPLPADGDVPSEVDGRLNLVDFAERCGFRLPAGPYETLGGFLMARLGRLARVGDEVDVNGYRLVVTALDGRRVARVGIVPPPRP